MSPDTAVPSHDHVVTRVLGVGQPRPAIPAGLVDELSATVRSGLQAVLAGMPPGRRLAITKATLDALACEGRFVDLVDRPFAWSAHVARGKLVHRAIEIDWATQRRFDAGDVTARAWGEMAGERPGEPGSLGTFLATLDPMSAALLRHAADHTVGLFRETWPQLPDAWLTVRLEERMKLVVLGAPDGDGRHPQVVVDGRPDMTIASRRDDDRCRRLLVDLKTGARYPGKHRQEMRYYALLATLKYKQPPFRWATFYLDEGEADVEDLDADVLRSAARRVVDAAEGAARLRFSRPADAELELTAGAYCGWCGRRPTCAVAAEAWEARATDEGLTC